MSIFNFHYCVPPDTVAQNYNLNKPIGENETGFRGPSDATYRTEAWDFLLAGGALYNNLDYSFTTSHPDGTFADHKAPGGGSPAFRRQLKTLKAFIDGFDFVRMTPNQAVIQGPLPANITARALADPGRQYALYFKHAALGQPGNPNDRDKNPLAPPTTATQMDLTLDLPAGAYAVQWLNPSTGKTERSETLRHPGGPTTLHAPAFVEDLALSLRTAP